MATMATRTGSSPYTEQDDMSEWEREEEQRCASRREFKREYETSHMRGDESPTPSYEAEICSWCGAEYCQEHRSDDDFEREFRNEDVEAHTVEPETVHQSPERVAHRSTIRTVTEEKDVVRQVKRDCAAPTEALAHSATSAAPVKRKRTMKKSERTATSASRPATVAKDAVPYIDSRTHSMRRAQKVRRKPMCAVPLSNHGTVLFCAPLMSRRKKWVIRKLDSLRKMVERYETELQTL